MPKSSISGTLYLIPAPLGNPDMPWAYIPGYTLRKTAELKVFIAEEIRTTRRFLRKIDPDWDIDNTLFFEFNEHSGPAEAESCLQPLLNGSDAGLISEAGMPCVADPGAAIVALAHQRNIRVIPLPGASSIDLALAASGFNGQGFVFHGYLPREKEPRVKKIRSVEQAALSTGLTQIFIEAPYRNPALADAITSTCRPETMLCIALSITLPDEQIICMSVKDWKHSKVSLKDRPAVFLISRGN